MFQVHNCEMKKNPFFGKTALETASLLVLNKHNFDNTIEFPLMLPTIIEYHLSQIIFS